MSLKRLYGGNVIDQELDHDVINFCGKGLQNCGSSCFMNSVLQMFFHIPEFREFLICYSHIFEDLYIKSKGTEKEFSNKIVFYISRIFIKMKEDIVINSGTPIKDSYTLDNFYQDIQSQFIKNDGGTSREDRDASQLISYLFEHIENSIIMYFSQNNILLNYDFNILFNLKINIPLINFVSQMITNTKCIDNIHKNNTYKYEQISYHTIEEQNSDNKFHISLLESKEILDIDNNITNCKIKDTKNTENNIQIEPNNYLIIMMKRFKKEYDKTTGQIKLSKNESNIYIDGHLLDQKDDNIIIDRNGNKYILIGSIMHSGGLDGGHYIYNHRIINTWNTYNDSNMIENNFGMSNQNMYILLFRKIDAQYKIPVLDPNLLNDEILFKMKTFKFPDNYPKIINEYDKLFYYYANKFTPTDLPLTNKILEVVKHLGDKRKEAINNTLNNSIIRMANLSYSYNTIKNEDIIKTINNEIIEDIKKIIL